MESYRILVRRSAAGELADIPKRDLARVVARIGKLALQPRPDECEKLSGQERYRVRQGDYRVVYSIDDEGRVVEIVKIGRRSEIYRR